jgi:8-oxo-dGTP pyrophosphatase MutT (NUDIX family)
MDPEDETLADTAIRELVEETGYTGPITLTPGENVRHGRTEGHIFLGVVPREFRPKLNWEHTSAKWVRPEQLKRNELHWALVQLFSAA